MPELPEVHTTVQGIIKKTKGLTIIDVWTDYGSAFNAGKNNIKNKKFLNASQTGSLLRFAIRGIASYNG